MKLIDDSGREVDLVVYSGDGDEWSALYVNGALHRVGDHYLIDEALRSLLNVQQVESSSYMLGGSDYASVAPTIRDIEEWENQKQEERVQRKAELQEQARKLLEEAASL